MKGTTGAGAKVAKTAKIAKIAIIGGSGVYDATMLNNVSEIEVDTPFGKPSDKITIGDFNGTGVAFLPRHGKGHRYSPTNLNYRANIHALKQIGVEHIIAASAVGSLREEYKPLDIVIPDQIFDRTKHRVSTFFDDIVVHMGFADPFCPELSGILASVTKECGYSHHTTGTYVCMEGPQFSTRAESKTYRKMGFDIIGMTALPEAKLAREAEMCYGMLATVTDYDVWHEEDVTIEAIIANAIANEAAVRDIIRGTIKMLADKKGHARTCGCSNAIAGALTTSKDAIPQESRGKLDLLIGKYL